MMHSNNFCYLISYILGSFVGTPLGIIYGGLNSYYSYYSNDNKINTKKFINRPIIKCTCLTLILLQIISYLLTNKKNIKNKFLLEIFCVYLPFYSSSLISATLSYLATHKLIDYINRNEHIKSNEHRKRKSKISYFL